MLKYTCKVGIKDKIKQNYCTSLLVSEVHWYKKLFTIENNWTISEVGLLKSQIVFKDNKLTFIYLQSSSQQEKFKVC